MKPRGPSMTIDDLIHQIEETERLIAVYRNVSEVIVGTQDQIYARRGLMNRTTLTAAEIGDTNPACPGNTISGGVRIRSNDRHSVELEKDTVGGSVEVWASHPAITGTTIGGSLLCHQGSTLGHYDSDDALPNTIHGTDTCA